MDLYRAQILELWRNPQNFGEIKNPDLEAYDLNPLCGDEVKIQAKLDDISTSSDISSRKFRNKRLAISEVRFTGNGCAISQASASVLTEMIKGKKLSEAAKIERENLLSELGIHPGPTRIKCVLLPLLVWKKALKLKAKISHASRPDILSLTFQNGKEISSED